MQVGLVRFIDPPFTLTMLEASHRYSRARGEWQPWTREWRDLDALGEAVPRAVVAAEDARFWLHAGVDMEGVCRAMEKNRERARRGDGRRVGGSTITQQAARNLFLWQGQSWLRKGLELVYALWMELLLPKERILELYLNVAETGVLTFGVEAGAERYFGKPAAELSAEQAARLAAVLPSPRRWSIDGPQVTRRSARILAQPAPWPGEPGFQEARERARRRGWGCGEG